MMISGGDALKRRRDQVFAWGEEGGWGVKVKGEGELIRTTRRTLNA